MELQKSDVLQLNNINIPLSNVSALAVVKMHWLFQGYKIQPFITWTILKPLN